MFGCLLIKQDLVTAAVLADELSQTTFDLLDGRIVSPLDLIPSFFWKRLIYPNTLIKLVWEYSTGELPDGILNCLVGAPGTDASISSGRVDKAGIPWIVPFEKIMKAAIFDESARVPDQPHHTFQLAAGVHVDCLVRQSAVNTFAQFVIVFCVK